MAREHETARLSAPQPPSKIFQPSHVECRRKTCSSARFTNNNCIQCIIRHTFDNDCTHDGPKKGGRLRRRSSSRALENGMSNGGGENSPPLPCGSVAVGRCVCSVSDCQSLPFLFPFSESAHGGQLRRIIFLPPPIKGIKGP